MDIKLEKTGSLQKYVPEFVYGGVDGTITTLAIVAASAGAGLPTNIILILGLANVVADGFSMGISSYLSAQAEEEMGISNVTTAFNRGVATFLSFIIIGLIPLLAFIVAYLLQLEGDRMYPYAYMLSGVAFVLIGGLKSFYTERSFWKSGLHTALIGGIGALISYNIGYMLRGIN